MVAAIALAHADDEPPRTEAMKAPTEALAEDAAEDAGENASQFENIYAEMDLEQLMRIQVDSVAGIAQDWFATPAAIYVIDSDDIARSGHQHIAEALRLVPGVQVARVNARQWAVSVRGFNRPFTNKLQVVIDGREVYDAIFAGVRWQYQDMVLEDLDRIEVIRGPGATLWGANSVNGVINIESKSTKDTQGFYLKEIVGTELRNVTAMRYGGQIGDDTYYRVWGKYTDHDSFGPTGDDHNFDDWRIGHSGFRVDHEGVEDTTVTLQGEAFYSDQMGEQFSIPNSMPFSTTRVRGDNRGEGGHLLTRVKRRHPGGSGWSVTGYVDYFGFKSLDDHEVDLLTTSLDWRHHLDIGDRQNFIWGAGYRLHYYETEPGASVAFDPPRDEMHLFSAFAQDTITLEPDRWFFMLGSKFEHNDRSGFEIQPSARLWWTPDDRQTVWGSVSRAVRRPSPADEDLNLTLMRTASPPPNDEVEIRGSDIDAENVMAYEMGYRNRLSEEVTFDTAAFLNIYDDLVVLEQRGEDLVIVNGGEAESYGLETSVRWRPASNLSLTGSYSLLLIHAHGPMTDDIEDLAPTHQFHARSDYDVTDNVALHGALYFVDDVGNVPPYWRLDTGITWRVNENVDLSLWGQNLLDNRHPEFESSASASPDATEVERGAYLQLRCRF